MTAQGLSAIAGVRNADAIRTAHQVAVLGIGDNQ